ncbi:hypothetical protein EYC84_005510 [Monilinia fructicola]|uniref:Zn(2)-C6 fungal-type domain-containing protein n=2 Tax=Monilinia fructicola TaxID=38448 RepID=A0A5M9K0K4_MONFR|nr:hypothetical protein EYC84_005510 [Monilinia fructicola]
MFLVISPPPQEKRDSDIRERVSVPLRKRRGLPKVHSGCTTCKARRIKCDEGKPECYRCKIFYKGTSQKCGYLTREFPKAKSKEAALVTRRNILPKNVGQSEILPRESIRSFSDIKFESPRHFQYFRFFSSDVTTQVFSGFFPELWNRAVLQACHHETLFSPSLTHIQSAANLLQEWMKDREKRQITGRNMSPAPDVIEDAVLATFHSTHIGLVSSLDPTISQAQDIIYGTRMYIPSLVPVMFASIDDAGCNFTAICRQVITFLMSTATLIRREPEPIENDAADSAIWSKRMLDRTAAMDEFKEILNKIEQWKIAFEPLAKRVAKNRCLLRNYLFEEVVKLCKTVAAHPSFEKGFVFYAGIVPSLTAASRFGAINTRKEAIKVLLDIVPRREGSWDAAVSARHAIAVMKMEYEKSKQAARRSIAVVNEG